MKKNIVVAVGCRPDAIKMMPLFIELKKRKDVKAYLLSSGQHKEMLQQVFDTFGVYPDFDLEIMKESQDLFDISINILEKSKQILLKLNPDIVLVHGDTSTAFNIGLACFYLQIPVGHVEAGLRTYNLKSPFPEEFNRQAISLFSDYNFAPTLTAKKNLIRDGVDQSKIWITGNTIVDAMNFTVNDEFYHPILDWVGSSKFILITAHRRENIGKNMRNMFRAIRRVLDEHSDVKAVYPIHLNPLVRKIADEELKGCSNIKLIDPIGVFECHNFESRCYLCLTDSGGIQEECPKYGKPVLVMRDTTERPEGVSSGVLKLLGTNEDDIYKEFTNLLDNESEYMSMSKVSNPFGDGNASTRIADILTKGSCDEFDSRY